LKPGEELNSKQEMTRDFKQMHTLIANISEKDKSNDNQKTIRLTAITPALNKTNSANIGPLTKKYVSNVYQPKLSFWEDHISAHKGHCHLKF